MVKKTALILICLFCNQISMFAQEDSAADTTDPIIYAIEITGNHLTKPELILREMELKVGMRATTKGLERSRLQIASLGLFNRVEMVLAEDKGRAVLQVKLTEPFYLYPYVNGRYDHNRPERAVIGGGIYHYNFRGMGERLGAAAWGGYSRGGTVFLDDPWFSIRGKYGIDGRIFYSDEKVKILQEHLTHLRFEYEINDPIKETELKKAILNKAIRRESYGINLSFKRRLGLRHSVELGNGWEIIDSDSAYYSLTPGNRDRMASVTLTYKNDKRNYRYYPTSGFYVLTIIEANRLVDMNHNFYREMLDLRSYQSIGKAIFAYRLWGEFGQHKLPFYKWLSVGRELIRAGKSDAKPKGMILGGNIELRFPLIKPFYYSFEQIPLAGPYLRDMMFSLEGVIFGDGGFAGMPSDERTYFGAFGFGLQAQLPYIKIAHFLIGWTSLASLDEPTLFIRNGVTF